MINCVPHIFFRDTLTRRDFERSTPGFPDKETISYPVRVPTSPLRSALTAPKDPTTVPSMMFSRANRPDCPRSRLLGPIRTMSVRTLFTQPGIVQSHSDKGDLVDRFKGSRSGLVYSLQLALLAPAPRLPRDSASVEHNNVTCMGTARIHVGCPV